MKINFYLMLFLPFWAINSANGINEENLKKFALQETLNPYKLPTTLSLFEDSKSNKVKWSILIATIEKRSNMFINLLRKLMSQIVKNKLEKKIEVIFYKDKCRKSVGYKRNMLIQNAHGKYICFIDDDDDIDLNYIQMIYEKLQNNPDCLQLIGIMTQPGKKPIKRIHSIKYKEYINTEECLYRPPTHINVIKKSIAAQFKFPELNFSEDKWWAMEIVKSGLLKKEAKVAEPYYFYNFDPLKSETWKQRFAELIKISREHVSLF